MDEVPNVSVEARDHEFQVVVIENGVDDRIPALAGQNLSEEISIILVTQNDMRCIVMRGQSAPVDECDFMATMTQVGDDSTPDELRPANK